MKFVIEVEIPFLPKDIVQLAVAKWDELESGKGQGIVPENVDGEDILTFLQTGNHELEYTIETKWESK